MGAAGTVGAASAATVAAVVVGGLAIGAAIGYGLRQAFGEAKAVRAEEAAGEAQRQLRIVRAQYEQAKGRSVTPAEAKKFYHALEVELERLGFTQLDNGQWVRERGALERLLG